MTEPEAAASVEPLRIYESLGNVPSNVEVVFVTDRRGDVWRIVRDGGMAARVTVSGEVQSAGVRWLAANLGPLVAFDPVTYRAERGCGCCPTCGAMPGHQNPPTGEPWQHAHTQGASDV